MRECGARRATGGGRGARAGAASRRTRSSVMGEIRRGMREYLAIGVFYVLCVAARAIEIAIDAFGFARRARSIVRRSIARSIDRSMARDRWRAISRARASGIPAHAHFYNVCPSRFLLRRPRRRLQGDQDPSAYFLAFARRATTRGTTTRARDAIASRAIDRRREIRDIARAARIASSRRGTCDAAKGVAGSDVDDYL